MPADDGLREDENSMSQWEYLRLDLNDAPRRGTEIDVLNRPAAKAGSSSGSRAPTSRI